MTYTIKDEKGNKVFSIENSDPIKSTESDNNSAESIPVVAGLVVFVTMMAIPGIASWMAQNKGKRLLSKILKELSKDERETLASYETSLEAAKSNISSEIYNIIGSAIPTNWKIAGYYFGGDIYYTNINNVHGKFNNDNKGNSRELIRHTLLDKPNFNETMKLQLFSIALRCPYNFDYTETSEFNTNKAMTNFDFMNTITEVTNDVKGKILEKLNSYKEIPKTDCKIVNRGFDYDTYRSSNTNDIIISPYMDYEPSKKVVNIIKKIQTVGENLYKKMKINENILR